VPEINIKIKIKGFQDGLFDLLEDANITQAPLEAKRLAENYLIMFKGIKNYEELDSTTKAVLNSYHPEIFKGVEQTEQTQAYRLPKSSS